MHNQKRIPCYVFLITLLFGFHVTLAQDTQEEVFDTPMFETIILDTIPRYPAYGLFYFSPGYMQLRDHFLSPLHFSGINVRMISNRFVYKKNSVSLTKSEYAFGGAGNMTNESALISTLAYGLSYGELFHIHQNASANTRFHVGPIGEVNVQLNTHLGNVNNVLSYGVALSLGAGALFEHKFTLFNRPFMLSNNLSLPVFSVLTRNPFAFPFPDLSEEAYSFWDILQVGSWNRLVHVQNQVSLDFYINQRRRKKVVARHPYRLTYFWSYMQMSHPNLFQMGIHSIGFAKIIGN
jgi:hypothetical protein